jgi:hypothetical protein
MLFKTRSTGAHVPKAFSVIQQEKNFTIPMAKILHSCPLHFFLALMYIYEHLHV